MSFDAGFYVWFGAEGLDGIALDGAKGEKE